MKLLPEKDYRQLFRIGILVKAVDGFIEACGGVFFYFTGYTIINGILFSVFHEEIAESPRDAFWQFFINQWHSISLSSNSFWGLLFFAHGVIKLALSVALLKNYLWAYPTGAIVFTVFVGYEIYSLTNHPSLFLWCITIFDALVVGLILHEYRHIKKRRAL
jgi:uncharacterized membrane protein